MTKQFPKPPFKAQPQSIPGRSDQMEPQPDYGEGSYRGSNKLRDKKTVITGADSGIGRAVALAFAREGADVLVSYLDEHDDANETKRLAPAAPPVALYARRMKPSASVFTPPLKRRWRLVLGLRHSARKRDSERGRRAASGLGVAREP